MEEEEDWDAPEDKNPPRTSVPESSQPSDPTTPQQTLKITDGYKYSYEANASPANIDDWVDPPSYGGGRRSNGYSQNSFRDRDRDRDNNRPYDRNDANARFNAIRRNDSFPNDSPRGGFGTPKPNRFQNRSMPTPVADWDAPDPSANQMNGSWKPTVVNTPLNTAADMEEDWDAPEGTPSQRRTPVVVDIPIFNPKSSSNKAPDEEDWDAPSKNSKPIPVLDSSRNTAPIISAPIVQDEEDWDEPSGIASKSKPVTPVPDIPTFRPEKSTPIYKDNSTPNINLTNNDEENWDTDAPGPSTPGNGFAADIPTYRPSGPPSNQRFDNNFQSNEYQPSKGFGDSSEYQPTKGFGDSNDRYGNSDHFGREPFRRQSRENRHNPYERNDSGGFRGRGRGGDRGGRGFDRGGRGFDRGGRGFDRGGRGFDRGGRGFDRGGRGREGRDNFQSPYSRDGSRSRDRGDRGDRGDRDRSYQNSFSRNSDRSPYQAPPPSFNNEPEEDWDSPTGFKQAQPPPTAGSSDVSALAPAPAPAPALGGGIQAVPIEQSPIASAAAAAEESWD